MDISNDAKCNYFNLFYKLIDLAKNVSSCNTQLSHIINVATLRYFVRHRGPLSNGQEEVFPFFHVEHILFNYNRDHTSNRHFLDHIPKL